MRRLLLVLAVAAALLGGLFVAPAQALTDADRAAVRGILAEYRSPLPPWTIEAFAESHPDFDLAGYLAVMFCESRLGTIGGSARYNNPGNIKFCGWMDPADLRVWLRWQNGAWYSPEQGWYGTYPSMYWGQRAAIRLIYDAGYNAQLAAHDWRGFARRYYGSGPGLEQYIRNLRAAHALMVRKAAAYGAGW